MCMYMYILCLSPCVFILYIYKRKREENNLIMSILIQIFNTIKYPLTFMCKFWKYHSNSCVPLCLETITQREAKDGCSLSLIWKLSLGNKLIKENYFHFFPLQALHSLEAVSISSVAGAGPQVFVVRAQSPADKGPEMWRDVFLVPLDSSQELVFSLMHGTGTPIPVKTRVQRQSCILIIALFCVFDW